MYRQVYSYRKARSIYLHESMPPDLPHHEDNKVDVRKSAKSFRYSLTAKAGFEVSKSQFCPNLQTARPKHIFREIERIYFQTQFAVSLLLKGQRYLSRTNSLNRDYLLFLHNDSAFLHMKFRNFPCRRQFHYLYPY